ncbi:MAG: carbamoyl-phosphate synthase large subunit, partial [Acidimicrobiales bacterium]
CNPETVSTDYDTSDRLYFEPLTDEDVIEVIRRESQAGEMHGVVVQLGGQTPLKIAAALEQANIPILGTSPDAIDLAEDRERFQQLVNDLKLRQPENGIAHSAEEARDITARVGLPVVIRPSYVLGGRAMEVVHHEADLERYMRDAVVVSGDNPVLIDSFLNNAIEVDVDALCDGEDVYIGGIMEHIEEAGIHSGDSACSLPPQTLSDALIDEIRRQTEALARALGVVGLMNVQFAIKDEDIYLLEVNPRGSRTVPFVAKATGVPLAKIASRIMVGTTLAELRREGLMREPVEGDHVAVKEAVLPFNRFPEADAVLGPEMRSTGEVMGIDLTPGLAFVKSQLAAGLHLPTDGMVFLSLADRDKDVGVEAARIFTELGFTLAATSGTAAALRVAGLDVAVEVAKLGDNDGENAVDLIERGDVKLVVNSPRGRGPRADGDHIRSAAGMESVPLLTTGKAALAAAKGLRDWKAHRLAVRSLQEYHAGVSTDALEAHRGAN